MNRADRSAVLHAGIGKASFTVEQLEANIVALVRAVLAARPKGVKGGAATGCAFLAINACKANLSANVVRLLLFHCGKSTRAITLFVLLCVRYIRRAGVSATMGLGFPVSTNNLVAKAAVQGN